VFELQVLLWELSQFKTLLGEWEEDQGASCKQGTVSLISIVGSISSEGFLSLILLLVVIIALVVIVEVVIVVVVIGVVIVVGGVSFIVKLSFIVVGFLSGASDVDILLGDSSYIADGDLRYPQGLFLNQKSSNEQKKSYLSVLYAPSVVQVSMRGLP
ncbi:hypothetical protein Tco_1452096, partial [Tanacetum coccineum]